MGSVSFDPISGRAYWGTTGFLNRWSQNRIITMETMTPTGQPNISASVSMPGSEMALSGSVEWNGYGYFGANVDSRSTIIKIDLGMNERVGQLFLPLEDANIRAATKAPNSSYAYFG